jgi:NADPH-dependent glutamate synthase beta subunit-like oxidoreductase
MKTSKRGVFAGGDVVTGGATVILAMGQAEIGNMDLTVKTLNCFSLMILFSGSLPQSA